MAALSLSKIAITWSIPAIFKTLATLGSGQREHKLTVLTVYDLGAD